MSSRPTACSSQARTLRVDLYGSVACTGREIGTDRAILAGLCGEAPESVEPAALPACAARVGAEQALSLGGRHRIAFDPDARHSLSRRQGRSTTTATRSGSARATAPAARSSTKMYFSIGDGQILAEGESPGARARAAGAIHVRNGERAPRARADQGKAHRRADAHQRARVAQPRRGPGGTARVAEVMRSSVERGLAANGMLPGGGHVAARGREGRSARRQPRRRRSGPRCMRPRSPRRTPAGGRVVAAPSNGSAGPVAARAPPLADQPTPMASDEGIGRVPARGGSRRRICCADVGAAPLGLPGRSGRRRRDGGRRPRRRATMRATARCSSPRSARSTPYKGLTCDPDRRPRAGPLHRPQRARGRACACARRGSGLRQPEPAQVALRQRSSGRWSNPGARWRAVTRSSRSADSPSTSSNADARGLARAILAAMPLAAIPAHRNSPRAAHRRTRRGAPCRMLPASSPCGARRRLRRARPARRKWKRHATRSSASCRASG